MTAAKNLSEKTRAVIEEVARTCLPFHSVEGDREKALAYWMRRDPAVALQFGLIDAVLP